MMNVPTHDLIQEATEWTMFKDVQYSETRQSSKGDLRFREVN